MSTVTRSRESPVPWWAGIVIGVLIAVTGILLLTRPFRSVSLLILVLGLALIISAASEAWAWYTHRGERVWWRLPLAVILLAAGFVVLFAPGLTVRAVVLIVGIALIVLGARDIVHGIRGSDDGLSDVLGGVASIIFGILALTWRDVTVLLVGALFGIWLIVTGVRQALAALSRRPGAQPVAVRPAWRWVRPVASAAALVLAIVSGLVGAHLYGQPTPDAFYAAPDDIPDQPGQLLRSESMMRSVPDGAVAWRILYTTTRDDGIPAIASGIVVVPEGVEAPPTIAWTHGTTGVAVGCAPSLAGEPFVAGAMPDFDKAIAEGWAVVATDYVGLGADAPHPYLVGQPEGRSALDAVRVSRQLPGVTFGDEVVVWGHSQGGGAALWTGGLAASYAPELDIVGVAAMAPAANLSAMAGTLADNKAGTLVGPLILAGYSGHYDDVRIEDYVRPEARLLVEETIARCWTDRATIVSVLEAGVIDTPIWSRSPTTGPLGEHVSANVPRLPIPAGLLIAQGLADPLVLPDAQQQYVDELCAAGQQVDYRTYEGKDHMGIVRGDSPLLDELMQWTRDRLSGATPTNTCA